MPPSMSTFALTAFEAMSTGGMSHFRSAGISSGAASRKTFFESGGWPPLIAVMKICCIWTPWTSLKRSIHGMNFSPKPAGFAITNSLPRSASKMSLPFIPIGEFHCASMSWIFASSFSPGMFSSVFDQLLVLSFTHRSCRR